MDLRSFKSPDDVLRMLDVANAEADVQMQPWQAATRPGDCYVEFAPGAGGILYGEILDPPGVELEGGERYVRVHSRECPEGECDFTHAGRFAGPFSREQFDRARAHGWPDDQAGFARVIANDPRWRPKTQDS
jgi:hypothetical protein